MKKEIFISLIFLSVCLFSCDFKHEGNITKDSSFIWIDEAGEGRQEYLIFRQDFELDTLTEGQLNLWAHSRYKLYVNGDFVGFGPVRSYPDAAEYDSYNLSKYLRTGKNYITVQVLQNGVINYQVPVGPGAFIAWGEISNGKKLINLKSPGNWRVVKQGGFDPTSPKMTFATGVMESYDESYDCNWNLPECNDCNWNEAITLLNQDFYKITRERSIPFLTSDELPAKEILSIHSLKDDKDVYSFRIKINDRTREEFNKNKRAFAETYIFSPEDQVVEAGLWWGEVFLNGNFLTEFSEPSDIPSRRNYNLNLKQGWNHFFISYGIVWASWDFYMTLPKFSGLVLSPLKELNDEYCFRTAGPFEEEFESQLKELELPFSDPNLIEQFNEQWKYRKTKEKAGNPSIEIAWSRFDKEIDNPSGFPVSLNPGHDYALVLDMGGKTLGRFFMEYEGQAGVTVNIGFAEDLNNDRPWVLKRAGIYTGLRFKTAKTNSRLESFKPYGARYIQVNISGITSPFTIRNFGMVSQVFPYEKKADFECSDTMLNAIWELGWRTIRVCSEDSYTDTPFRERGLYAGDALPEYAISLATADESRLMKRSIRVFAEMYRDLMQPGSEKVKNSVNHMADYPLMTLVAYCWTSRYTDDMEFAREFYQGYSNMMKNYLSRKMDDGSFDHDRAFIEWTQIDRTANLTTIQSLILYSLDEMKKIAGLLGEKEDEEFFGAQKKLAINVLKDKYWDEEKGAFRDGYKDGAPISHYYPISSAWPVMFGQVDEEQKEKIKAHFRESLADIGEIDRKRLATPYGSFFVLEALYQLGMEDLAEEFILKHWSPMILKYNDTAWENFGDGSDGSGQGTLSHAWSGHPTFHLSNRVLGIDYCFPVKSSTNEIVLSPQVSSITWAKGSVAYKDGIIQIDWKIDGSKLYFDYQDNLGRDIKVVPRGILADKELIINSRNLY